MGHFLGSIVAKIKASLVITYPGQRSARLTGLEPRTILRAAAQRASDHQSPWNPETVYCGFGAICVIL